MNKLRGIITLALLSCIVTAIWGCDFQQQTLPKHKVVWKKIVAKQPTNTIAGNTTPAVIPKSAAVKTDKPARPAPVVKTISAPELRPKSDIAATPMGRSAPSVVAKTTRASMSESTNIFRAKVEPLRSKELNDLTAKNQPAVAEETTKEQGGPIETIQPRTAPVAALTPAQPSAEVVPSSAAVIQPATAPMPPKPVADETTSPGVAVAAVSPSDIMVSAAPVGISPEGAPAPYNPQGRINPFEPLFKDEPEITPVIAKKKRIPRTPLERIDLGQLKLVGIILASSGNRALVQEASGKGYIIREGTFIGLHSGKVTEIKKDRVVIEEESDEVVGTQKMRNKELVLPKPPGE